MLSQIEKVSILNNIHLVRDKKISCLSSSSERTNLKNLTYAGRIYNLNEGISIYNLRGGSTNQTVKPFKKRIRVNLSDLNKIDF